MLRKSRSRALERPHWALLLGAACAAGPTMTRPRRRRSRPRRCGSGALLERRPAPLSPHTRVQSTPTSAAHYAFMQRIHTTPQAAQEMFGKSFDELKPHERVRAGGKVRQRSVETHRTDSTASGAVAPADAIRRYVHMHIRLCLPTLLHAGRRRHQGRRAGRPRPRAGAAGGQGAHPRPRPSPRRRGSAQVRACPRAGRASHCQHTPALPHECDSRPAPPRAPSGLPAVWRGQHRRAAQAVTRHTRDRD